MANWRASFEINGDIYEANVKADTVDGAIEELRTHWAKVSEFPVNIIEVTKINYPQ